MDTPSDQGTGPRDHTDQADAGRVWLVTGCSAGFGRAIAEAALARGDTVVATARRPEAIAVAGPAEHGHGGRRPRLHRLALDVTDPAAIAHAVDATLERFGRIDILVNNAGHGSVGAVEELTMDELRALFEVMFFGSVELTKAVLPHMRAQGTGAIVQVSSMGGQLAMPAFGAYCAAKFALEGLSEALAGEVEALGIRVLVVEPGAFRTEFGGARMHRSAVLDAYRARPARPGRRWTAWTARSRATRPRRPRRSWPPSTPTGRRCASHSVGTRSRPSGPSTPGCARTSTAGSPSAWGRTSNRPPTPSASVAR